MTRPGDPPTPQPSQPQQFGQAPYPPPTKKKHGPSFWILIALGVIVLIALGSCAVALIGGARQVAKDLSNTSSVEATQAEPTDSTAPTSTAPTKKGYSPKKTDFAIKIKTTSKQCFGSAGCNLEIKVSSLRTQPRSYYPSTGEIDISYTIKGGEDPLEGTLTVYLDDDPVQADVDEQFLSTRSKSVKLTATVTAVEYNP
jgi:hypothetical protein